MMPLAYALPALPTAECRARAKGLLERLRCAGNVPTVSLYLQYVAIMCAIPVLRMFPSDIIVGVFKKKAAD